MKDLRKLDVAIAELWRLSDVPHYSTDANAMLELEKEMRGEGWLMCVEYILPEKQFIAYYENEYYEYYAIADTEPLARALAAYKALTGEEWEG